MFISQQLTKIEGIQLAFSHLISNTKYGYNTYLCQNSQV